MQEIKDVLTTTCDQLFGIQPEIILTRPDEKFGDFATNVALQLAGKVGKNPREIAELIAVKIRENSVKSVKTIEVAGPGFLNITLSDAQLLAQLHATAPKTLSGQKVLVEYSDPNPLKPLHAGHLYTTLVGDAIARLVERAGGDIVRLNYGGDVGLHVGKSLWAIIQALGGENPESLAEIAEAERPAWLGARYVEGNHAYEDDEVAKEQIIAVNKKVYALHETGDKTSSFAQIYWTVRQWSYDYFAVLYRQLGVAAFNRFIPESEVTPLGLRTVREHTGTVYEQSDGAVVYRGDEEQGLHTRVFINSEGLPTYEAKEVGLLETKWNDYQFDASIVITASEQDQYMQVVFASIAQFQPEAIRRTRHITHGVVKLSGGVKMSSRKGNIVSALDILDAARQAGQASGKASDEHIILAAVKYAFLKNRIGADVVYDPSESVALEGNSGPYLQYAHARAQSILSKSTVTSLELNDLTEGERSLVRKLGEYSAVVTRSANELLPHHVCTYLYELAQVFNRFYEHNRVIGDAREAQRLSLISAYANVLRDGLELLGIHAPDKM